MKAAASTTTADSRAYDAIRDLLLAGPYAAGSRIKEASLAADLALSRSSVRSALMRLEHDGFVERLPNRGARVRRYTPGELLEATEALGELEAMIARHTCRRVQAEDVESLRRIERAIEAMVRGTDVVGYFRHDTELHEAIVRLGDQRVTARLVAQLRPIRFQYRYRVVFVPGRLNDAIDEHGAIIDAIERRDEQGAADAVRAHYAASRRAFEQLFASPGFDVTAALADHVP
jgi:DNA-binding GntR family transcriptional regulator